MANKKVLWLIIGNGVDGVEGWTERSKDEAEGAVRMMDKYVKMELFRLSYIGGKIFVKRMKKEKDVSRGVI